MKSALTMLATFAIDEVVCHRQAEVHTGDEAKAIDVISAVYILFTGWQKKIFGNLNTLMASC